MTQEQLLFEGEAFEVQEELIINNKEIIADFFGDNRDWYKKLKQGGQTFKRTQLDSQEEYDVDKNEAQSEEALLHEADLAPLDPSRINEGRAHDIASFFKEYRDAKNDFVEYYKKQTNATR